MLVRDGHDDADGDEEEGGYAQGEEEAPPGEVDRVVLYHEDADQGHEDEGEEVPAKRRVGVTAHEAAVHVFSARDHAFSAWLGWVCGLPAEVVVVWCCGDGLVGCLRFVLVALKKCLLALSPDIATIPAGCVSYQSGE